MTKLSVRTAILALLVGPISAACGGVVQRTDPELHDAKVHDDGSGANGDGSGPLGQDRDGGTEAQRDGGLVPIGKGEVDPNAPEGSGLPPLPRLTSVSASVVGDSVSIAFDPVLNARDYRVYELPDPSDIETGEGGHVYVEGAVFRCAGNRQAPGVSKDAEDIAGGAMKTLVDGQTVAGYKRSLAEATLGYVYAEPGDGRVPVYALGENSPGSDNLCYAQRWTASRRKQYTTSETVRNGLLSKNLRDDGIVFYVPAESGAETKWLRTFADGPEVEFGARLYFNEGPESAVRTDAVNAFPVMANEEDDTVPLMRVFYTNVCGKGHDELVAGIPRFDLVRSQGSSFPLTRLHWSGLSQPTVLVVEALDEGCPFPGVLAPKSLKSVNQFADWVSPEDAQAASPHHELYINGQFDGTSPRPIARSFIRVEPAAKPDLDWSFGFSAEGALTGLAETAMTPLNCAEYYRAKSSDVDTQFYCPDGQRLAQRNIFGEWWVAFTDVAADTNGKYRLTPTTKGVLAGNSYLYVTMDVDSFTTLRRYPQILISDRDAPVQNNMPNGNTLVLQTFADWPNSYELQVCDHKFWDVNDQCKKFEFHQLKDANDPNKTVALAPNFEVGEQVGLDYSNRWEIYVSTERAYVFMDGHPYGCADLPDAGVPSGPVTVTFGHVLYHSGVDHLFDFTAKRLQTDSLRHYDNLGFKSHVKAPAWDETRFPCVSHLYGE